MKPSRLAIMVTVALLLTISPAFSQSDVDTGWFIGIGFGDAQTEVIGHDRSSQTRKNLTTLGLNVVTTSGGEHDNASNQTLRGGYKFCQYLALEAAYQNLGETTGSFNAVVLNPGDTDVNGRIKSEYLAVSLAVIGSYPLLDWLAIYSKLGVHHWNHEMHFSGSGTGINIDNTVKDSGQNILYAAGVELSPFSNISVLDKTSLRLEWEMFYGVEEEDGIDTLVLAVYYHF